MFLAALFGLFCSHVNATALVTVMVAMAGALVLVSILPHIIEFTISPKGVTAKVSRLENEVERNNEEIKRLNFLVSHLLTKPEKDHLRKIASGEVFEVNTENNFLWDQFRDEIGRLYNLGFIDYHASQGLDLFRSGEPKLRRVDGHCDIREPGREYLNLLDQVSGAQR